jgi:hypothetical protein
MAPEAMHSGGVVPIIGRVDVLDVAQGLHTLVQMEDIAAIQQLQKTFQAGDSLTIKADEQGKVHRNNTEVGTTSISGTIAFVA